MKLELALKGIMDHREIIHIDDLWSDPEKLSYEMLKLRVYNSYLGDNIATLHRGASEKRLKIYQELRGKDTQGDATVVSQYQSLKEREMYENVKNIHDDTSALIDTIRSRLKVISEQRKEDQL